MIKKCFFFIALLSLQFHILYSQKENAQWRFGNKAGLNFLTIPPTVTASSVNCCGGGYATQSDSVGNLQFYVGLDGSSSTNIFNKNNGLMANGANLTCSGGMQSVWIVPKQGSQYYVITHDDIKYFMPFPFPPMTYYYIVDMSLASGLGSVVVSSQTLSNPGLALVTKMAISPHCNGSDYWLLKHGGGWPGNNLYFAYLITPTAINPTPVVTAIGSNQTQSNAISHPAYPGQHKFSPNGRKVAATMPYSTVEIYDFNPSTGQLSNMIRLDSVLPPATPTVNLGNEQCVRGLEFSPDGSKLYVNYINKHPFLCQFDLSLPTPALIKASKTIIIADTFASNQNAYPPQIAYNGKLYIADPSATYHLGEISNPNLQGAACAYSPMAVYFGTTATSPFQAIPGMCLPNLISAYFEQKPLLPSITSSIICGVVNYSAPVLSAMAGYSVTSWYWNFNDPLSGTNTSTLGNPTHTFSANGTYTVKLALNYHPCGTDTLKQVININGLPQLGHGGRNPICKNESTVLNFTGASTYSLNMQSLPQNTVQIQPTVTTVYTLTGSDNSGCSSKKAFTITVLPCTSVQELEFSSNLKIYPNPNSGFFSLETKVSGEIIVINSIGQVVFRKRISEGQTEIDMGRHPKGIYILEWKNETTKGRMKLVLE